MCGIGGYVDLIDRIRPSILAGMTRALQRRGPDSDGVLIDGPCGLAHARLSIIDVAGSPQPMSDAERGLHLVFNGEIYNYQQIRSELRSRGHAFKTQGDTEVLLNLMSETWADGLPQLDAMFAFGAWDSGRQRLLLARDPIGEKPLFYATPSPGVLVFGSEIKVILEHPDVRRDLNLDALRQALRFRAVYGPESLHHGVRQLEPGSWLEFSREGLKTGRFHNLAAESRLAKARYKGLDDHALVEQGRQLFTESVEERLVADPDVPVGSFLSGGLDSSLIVATMRKLRPNSEIRTFSVGFADDPHSELPFARSVAEAIATRHTEINVGADVYIRRFAELSACRDGPVSQPADIAIAEMSNVAKQSVKVVLSGEGADEVFGGYPKYTFANAPVPLRWAMSMVGAHRVAGIAGMLGIDRRRTLVAARALSESREVDRYAQWFSYFDRQDLQALLPGLEWQDEQWALTTAPQQLALDEADSSDNLARMQTMDCLTWLPGNMLERGDRMTMAEGLEVRPPFLDKALCAFGLALPGRLKMRGNTGKWIVRQWAAEMIPEGVLGRRKWGFRTPLQSWFRGPLRDMLVSYVTSERGLCATFGDRKRIALMLEAHQSGAIDSSEALWTLLSAEVWYQDVFLSRAVTSPATSA
jgi:asparagine synthase (glutamine-hydrolysing)